MSILYILILIITVPSIYGFSNPAFFDRFKFSTGAINNNKEYFRLLTSGFLHADFMHLIFNMMTLYFFAPLILGNFGALSFVLLFLGSIVAGNLFTLWLYKDQPWYTAVGASGGVSGILFAAVALDPNGISVNFLPGYLFGAVYFGYSVYMLLNPHQSDNIGHSAHIGGAVLGLLFSIIKVPENVAHNAIYLGIMALPLIYLGYSLFAKKLR